MEKDSNEISEALERIARMLAVQNDARQEDKHQERGFATAEVIKYRRGEHSWDDVMGQYAGEVFANYKDSELFSGLSSYYTEMMMGYILRDPFLFSRFAYMQLETIFNSVFVKENYAQITDVLVELRKVFKAFQVPDLGFDESKNTFFQKITPHGKDAYEYYLKNDVRKSYEIFSILFLSLRNSNVVVVDKIDPVERIIRTMTLLGGK